MPFARILTDGCLKHVICQIFWGKEFWNKDFNYHNALDNHILSNSIHLFHEKIQRASWCTTYQPKVQYTLPRSKNEVQSIKSSLLVHSCVPVKTNDPCSKYCLSDWLQSLPDIFLYGTLTLFNVLYVRSSTILKQTIKQGRYNEWSLFVIDLILFTYIDWPCAGLRS